MNEQNKESLKRRIARLSYSELCRLEIKIRWMMFKDWLRDIPFRWAMWTGK